MMLSAKVTRVVAADTGVSGVLGMKPERAKQERRIRERRLFSYSVNGAVRGGTQFKFQEKKIFNATSIIIDLVSSGYYVRATRKTLPLPREEPGESPAEEARWCAAGYPV
jgi:hypothetical protein